MQMAGAPQMNLGASNGDGKNGSNGNGDGDGNGNGNGNGNDNDNDNGNGIVGRRLSGFSRMIFQCDVLSGSLLLLTQPGPMGRATRRRRGR